jgi:hypothetical protein
MSSSPSSPVVLDPSIGIVNAGVKVLGLRPLNS